MYNYPANETRFQPVNAPSVTTWFKSLQKWITGGRASQQWWLKEAPFTDSTQAHDDLSVRRLIEEMQRPPILIPHCIAISAMLGRPYLGRSGHESA
jgi:hypothetical protein